MHVGARFERYRCVVLGPLRVWGLDGGEVTPSGVLPRRLLALLVLRRGAVVTVDAAIELLWPEGGPNNPGAALHSHMSRLRRVLPGVIESAGEGYRLDPDRVVVDADELALILDSGGSAADLVARWVGPAYPELDMVDQARAESVRLEELRVRARESEASRRLAEGRTDGLAAELRAVVDEHPLREHPRALLIDALVATGRPADALRVYDEFRRLLADELGTEPSEPLQQRYRQLLAGDTGTAAPQPLPQPVTPILGRADLLADAETLLPDARLLTLVGPGGVGKTRMLLELGRRHTDTRVVWCELAGTDADGALATVAAALAIDVRPGIPLADRIAGVVGNAEILLLLDNCEHVLEPVAALVDLLLTRCPRLRVIATSRERLRVAGEQVRRVPPLAAGNAVELFLERAASVTGELDLDTTALDQVRAIVTRLDGLPLAIELAAARMYSHDVDEIALGLDRQFDFLSAGYRTTTRHGSLAAAVAWSVDLLDKPLRETFTNLSVFSGPFDLAAAAAVCATDRAATADRLTELTERSLVLRAPGRRYALLETLRTFGRTERATTDDRARTRHAHYFVDWVDSVSAELARSATAIARIDESIIELQRALHWLLDHDDLAAAARLVTALLDYGLLRLRPDILGWAEPVLTAYSTTTTSHTTTGHTAANPAAANPAAADAAAANPAATGHTATNPAAVNPAATGHTTTGHTATNPAATHSAAADPAATSSGPSDPASTSYAIAGLLAAAAYARWMVGDLPGAHERARRALAVCADPPHQVYSANGVCDLFSGRFDESAEWYRRAAVLPDRPSPSMDLATWVMLLGYAGDPTVGRRSAELVADTDAVTSPFAAYALYCAGEAVLGVDEAGACDLLDRAIRMAEATGTTFVAGVAGASRASLDVRSGRSTEAAAAYPALIRGWQRAGMWSTQWVMLRSIALLLDQLDRPEQAAVLDGAIRAATTDQPLGSDLEVLDQLSDRLRTALGDNEFEQAHRRGATLHDDALLAYTLEALNPRT
ncbi:ATP-binding protein [Nocardia lasii]|uniref:ATP-binding protein n=1 Tax=Nocardia lasii TaxID=1616107 RepID=A0ABW1JM58_9NOCA